MKSRAIALVMAVAVLAYAGLLVSWGLAVVRNGSPVAVVLGIGILAVPLLGVLAVVREIRFGVESARLARILVEEDGVPLETVARDAHGRVDLAAADIEWQRRKAIVDAAPEDWRAWFLLGIAYDNARDRKQGRAAVRKAIALRAAGGR